MFKLCRPVARGSILAPHPLSTCAFGCPGSGDARFVRPRTARQSFGLVLVSSLVLAASAEARPAALPDLVPLRVPLGYDQEHRGTPTVATPTWHGSNPLQGAFQSSGVVLRRSNGLRETAGDRAAGYSRDSADTLSFGNVDGDGFAILGDVWTFDHGGADPLEGWFGLDRTVQDGTFGRQITNAAWDADPWNGVDAPILSGQGSAWIGATGAEARELCWDSGLGYGNSWVQRIVSPNYLHDGASTVEVDWSHFNDTEIGFDYTTLYLETLPSGTRTALRAYTGQIGLAPSHPEAPPIGASDSVSLLPADFAGETGFRLVFEMTSDRSWSDEDALFETVYGPCGFDDISVSGFGADGTGVAVYGFEDDLDGWNAEAESGFGHEVGVASLGNYGIDPESLCRCDLDGNVLELHDENGEHVYGQHAYAVSAPVDVLNDVPFAGSASFLLFADWTGYLDLPRVNGVFVRPGWQYYPWTCSATGEVGWSPRVGSTLEFFWDPEPGCSVFRSIGTGLDEPVPQDAEQVRFLYELYASCDAFGIDPNDCTNETNFTPLLDNLQIRFTEVPQAPVIAVGLGLHFQDGFAQGTLLDDPTRPGRADVTRNVNSGNNPPIILGDSLEVSGPVVTGPQNQWEARFWFRVARSAPFGRTAYEPWRDVVNAARGVDIEAGEFAYAWMDSSQLGTQAFRNRFCTYLREDEWGPFGRSGPELSDQTEILPDNVLYPGAQIEYFLSSNFLSSPDEQYLLPDTSGGFFYEFEILPGWRDGGAGQARYPCILYIDAANDGTEHFVQAALNDAGITHDRYDYLDATSSWKAPMVRGFDLNANNGAPFWLLTGYSGILFSTGATNGTQVAWPEDYTMLSNWLTQPYFFRRDDRALVFNGDGVGTVLEANASSFVFSALGCQTVAGSYADYSGNPDDCVRVESPSGGGAYGTVNSLGDYEYDAWGNACPQEFEFDILAPVGTGIGNRVFVDLPEGTETPYSQVVNEGVVTGPGDDLRYKTVVDGVSWSHLVESGAGGCVPTDEGVVAAVRDEIVAALEWAFGLDVADFPGLCEDEGIVDPAVMDPGGLPTIATRLEPAAPNPFHPRTTLRFSLVRDEDVRLAIFDVSGRRVRTLVDGPQSGGVHELVWDGTDERGRPLASGTYWARLETLGHRSASRMVLLR